MSRLPIAASVIGIIGLLSMTTLLGLQVKNRLVQTREDRQGTWTILPTVTCFFCVLSSIATLATLAWLQSHYINLPATIVGASKQSLLTANFVLWGISSTLLGLFIFRILLVHRIAGHQSSPLRADEELQVQSEKQPTISQSAQSPQDSASPNELSGPSQARKRSVSDTTDSVSSRCRKRSASDTMNSLSSKNCKRSASESMGSLRSSITHVIRPTSSKTRLISQKLPLRRASLDSGTGEREIVDEGFDSWDMSAVDPQSREFFPMTTNSVPASSPITGRFLETIPASPAGSRSPSPACALDLEPPRRRRARSYSPATTARETRPRDLPKIPESRESHIHPLFRTDSPTPPPTATPGTIVTAAPGAGTVLVDRRAVHRIRSGSLRDNHSPLGYSRSMDDVSRRTEEDDEDSGRSSSPIEREMTPPIPEWVMGAGPRNSMSGYSRRKVLAGLGPVGEVRGS